MRTSEQINELVSAYAKARAQFKPTVRNAKGQVGQNREYRYLDLEGLIDATFPALLEQGIVIVQAVDAETASLVSRMAHTSGQWLESAYPLGKYDRPQDFGSQLTYARRYSLLGLLGVAQEDNDGADAQQAGDAPAVGPAVQKKPAAKPSPASPPAPAVPGAISGAQRKRLWAIATKHQWAEPVLKDWLAAMGFQSTKDITVAAYDDVISGLEAGPPQVN